MSDAPLIRCDGLVHVYPDGTRALDGINLEIGRGEIVALTGPNGAGKTTLVRHWNGLLRPTAGWVTIDGRPTAGRHVAELARSVGLVFQDPSAQLFASTCRAEVAFGPRNLGLRGEPLDRAVTGALTIVGLADAARSNPYDLAPSRRRLLAIASVIAMGTPVLVLDEPTAGFDDEQVAQLRRVLTALAELGRTVVAVSHDRRLLAPGLFDREIHLDAGRVVPAGMP
jgi:energy-coupling factor transport system ATP-binding protein